MPNRATRQMTVDYLMVLYRCLGIATELNEGEITGFHLERKKTP